MFVCSCVFTGFTCLWKASSRVCVCVYFTFTYKSERNRESFLFLFDTSYLDGSIFSVAFVYWCMLSLHTFWNCAFFKFFYTLNMDINVFYVFFFGCLSMIMSFCVFFMKLILCIYLSPCVYFHIYTCVCVSLHICNYLCFSL